MTDWRASVGTNGRYREEGVIPSGAEGGVEESVGFLQRVDVRICVTLRDLRANLGRVCGRPSCLCVFVFATWAGGLASCIREGDRICVYLRYLRFLRGEGGLEFRIPNSEFPSGRVGETFERSNVERYNVVIWYPESGIRHLISGIRVG